MNWAALASTLIPAILQLLNDPNFQTVVKAIESDLNNKIASGAHPGAAAQQATGLLGAAAMLHLTGNPVADFRSLVAGLKFPSGTMPS